MLSRHFITFVLILAIVDSSFANTYIRPRAGATVPVRGNDASFSVGATLGHLWLPFFATELSYTRLFAINANQGIEGNTFRATGIVQVPTGILAPYASIGVGMIHAELPLKDDIDTFVALGGGMTLAKLGFLSASIGAEYAIVSGGADFIEPHVAIGLHF